MTAVSRSCVFPPAFVRRLQRLQGGDLRAECALLFEMVDRLLLGFRHGLDALQLLLLRRPIMRRDQGLLHQRGMRIAPP
jgi:hypothetical protein